MSTSEFSTQLSQADSSDRAAALAAGLPDPAILSRLANELFSGQAPSATNFPAPRSPSISDAGHAPLPQAIVPPSASAPVTAQPAAAPSEADLRSLPARLQSEVHTGESQVARSSPLGTPGGVSAGDFSPSASFGFLTENRSLFSAVPAMPVSPAAPSVSIPTETADLRLPAQAKTPPVQTISPQASVDAPQISSAPSRGAIPQAPGFLSAINPLAPLTVEPTISSLDDPLSIPSTGDISSTSFDVAAVRRDFPILQERVNGKQLIWLDNAATTQKPQAVIDRLAYFYAHENSNIHRAAHTLAARSTDAYEAAREKVRRFLNAPSVRDIIFVRGATEGINFVAQSWGRRNINKGDEIVVTWLEHHANIVPWQMLAAEKGAKLRVAPVDDSGQIILEEYEKLLNPRTRLVAFAHVSNALGTITPAKQMIEMAHRHGAKVAVDGAQSVSHMPIDVQSLGADFYIFSGHKVFGPTGIGAVFGKSDVLEQTPPWHGGGNMIADVTFEKTIYHGPPARFEAGTGNIADAVGLGAAIDYVQRIGMATIDRYEHDLLEYATGVLREIPGLRLIGTAREKASVLSFVLDGFKTEEIGAALDKYGIAVRSGHHCAQPILRRFGVESTVRPSLAFYNTCEEIDALVAAIWDIKNGRTPGVG